MTCEAAALGLRAVNEENRVLTQEPETSFFLARHPRHTAFSMAYLTQGIGSNDTNGPPLINTDAPPGLRDVSDNNTPMIFTPLERSGDLVGSMYVRTTLPALNTLEILNADGGASFAGAQSGGTGSDGLEKVISDDAKNGLPILSVESPRLDQGGYCYADEIGNWLLEDVQLNINSHVVDQTSSEQRHAFWHRDHSDERLMQHSLGMGTQSERIQRAFREQVIYSPLDLFFCQSASHFFPLISMSRGDLTVGLRGRSWYSLYGGVRTVSTIPDLDQYQVDRDDAIRAALAAAQQDLIVETVFLDAPERAMFASTALEYVITVNLMESRKNVAPNEATYLMSRLNLRHPTRDLAVFVRPVSRTRPDVALDDIAPDHVYPVRAAPPTGGVPNPYHTPLQWNNFSGGTNPETLERVESLRNLRLDINGFNRLLHSDTSVGPLYREVDPVARKSPGRVHDTFGHHYSFGMGTQGATTSGTLNLSAISRIDLNLTRAADPMSSMTGGTGAYNGLLVTLGLYPPPAYQPIDVFIMTRVVNVLRFQSGHAGLAMSR